MPPRSAFGQSLLLRTQELLVKSDQPYLVIHAATGLTPSWLSLFATGKISEPSVTKVQKLYEHLSGQHLLGG